MTSFKGFLLLSPRQRKLYKRLEVCRGRLFCIAYSWSHNKDIADEVVQETMIKALKNVNSIKNIEAIDSWLFRILSNSLVDLCRKRREEIDIDDILLVEQDTPETIHHQNEMLVAVRSAIISLPFKHRQVLTLVDIENFTYAEVAKIIEIPQGTVMSRLNRARHALRQTLNTLANDLSINLSATTKIEPQTKPTLNTVNRQFKIVQ